MACHLFSAKLLLKWINSDLFFIGHLGTSLNEIYIKLHQYKKNGFENDACINMAILFWPQWVKTFYYQLLDAIVFVMP